LNTLLCETTTTIIEVKHYSLALSIKRPRHSTCHPHGGYAIEAFRQWRHMHSSPKRRAALAASRATWYSANIAITPRSSRLRRKGHAIYPLVTLVCVCRFLSQKLSGRFRNSSLARIILDYAKSGLTARDAPSMQCFGVAAFVAVAFVATAQAQSVYTTPALTTSAPLSAATTYTPTNVWAPNPTCSAGSSVVAQTGGYGGGVYRDDFGSYWEVLCNYDWTGTTWYDNPNGPK